jgi:hypothetical protein
MPPSLLKFLPARERFVIPIAEITQGASAGFRRDYTSRLGGPASPSPTITFLAVANARTHGSNLPLLLPSSQPEMILRKASDNAKNKTVVG